MSLLNNLRAPDGRPLRARAEVMIWRDGKVLITNGRSGIHTWHGLPGGGIDEGETPEEAAAREALEEVGIAVRNAKLTGETAVQPNPPGLYGARARMYGGAFTVLVKADFSKIDRSLLGIEGDAAPFTWMTPQEAINAISGDPSQFRDGKEHRLRELRKYI